MPLIKPLSCDTSLNDGCRQRWQGEGVRLFFFLRSLSAGEIGLDQSLVRSGSQLCTAEPQTLVKQRDVGTTHRKLGSSAIARALPGRLPSPEVFEFVVLSNLSNNLSAE